MFGSGSYLAPALALVVGVTLFAALHHFFIGLRRPQERIYLIFAALCVSAAIWATWGEPFTTTTQPTGPLFVPVVALTTLNFLFGLWASGRMWRRGIERRPHPFSSCSSSSSYVASTIRDDGEGMEPEAQRQAAVHLLFPVSPSGAV